MMQRECGDLEAFVLVDDGGLVDIYLDKVQFVIDLGGGDFKQKLNGGLGTHGGIYCKGLGASAEVHSGEQPGQPKEVVAVKVGYEDGLYGLEFLMVLAQLVLGRLAAVDKYSRATDCDELCAAMA